MSVNSFNASNPPLTTKGDLYGFSTVPTRVPVGTNGQVLTADSTATNGVAWATASAGGMTLITSGTLSGASVTLSSIPSTYKDLQLVIRNWRPANNAVYLQYRYNADSTANRHEYGSAIYSGDDTFERTEASLQNDTGNAAANNGLIILTFQDYANTSTWKMASGKYINTNRSTTTNFNIDNTHWSTYNQTGAISSLFLFPQAGNFTSGNYFLYGVS